MNAPPSSRPPVSRNLVVRPAVPADGAALARLAEALHRHQGDPTGHFTAEVIARDVFGPTAALRALIAELDDAPVGYALLHDAYETAHAARGFYVTDFFVMEEARARGVGRVLMAVCATFARAHGATFLWWVSKAWNVEAQKFYRTISPLEEPVMAHALTFERFTALAAEGEAHLVRGSS